MDAVHTYIGVATHVPVNIELIMHSTSMVLPSILKCLLFLIF
jgi:hypothetical protein